MAHLDISEHREFIKPGQLDNILSNLKKDSAKTRTAAARGLSGILNPEAVPALEIALKDGAKEVRFAALRALSEIASKSAIDALINVLDNPRPEIRAESARHLGMLRATRAAEKLKRILHSEQDIPAKQEMIEALGRLNDESALSILASFLNDAQPTIRWSATWAIGTIGRATKSQHAVEMLLLLEKHHDRRIQHEAASALRMINPKQI